jgi:hypothetical protein
MVVAGRVCCWAATGLGAGATDGRAGALAPPPPPPDLRGIMELGFVAFMKRFECYFDGVVMVEKKSGSSRLS